MVRELKAVGPSGPNIRISHARPDALLSHKVKAPLFLIDEPGQTHSITAWSLEGFERPATLDDKMTFGQLCINFQGFSIAFPVSFAPKSGGDDLVFKGLDRRQSELLRLFYAGIQSGQMGGIEETILSMDLPIERAAMVPTPQDEEREKKPISRVLRATAAISLYLALTGLVLGSLAYTIWANANFIEANRGLVVSDAGVPTIVAWLPDERIENAWIGMSSTVIANQGGERLEVQAVVTDLARQETAVDALETGVRVVATLDPADRSVAGLPDGHPVVLRLDRELLQRVWPW